MIKRARFYTFGLLWKRYQMFAIRDDILAFLSNAISEINNKIILIKDSDELSLKEVNNYLSKINSSNKSFYKNLKEDNKYEPYYPFVSFIKKEISKSSIPLVEFLDVNNIYPNHKQVFNTYITFNMAYRDEEIIPFDYGYEKNKLYESLLNIFNKYSEECEVYILLENINYMTYSTLEWMKWLVNNEKDYKFNLLLTINSYEYYKPELQDEFENFIEIIESKYSLLQVDNKDNKLEYNFNKQENMDKELINAGENFYQFFALNEALDCFNKKYEQIKNSEEFGGSKEEKDVLSRLGDIYLLKDDYHNAHIYYDLMLNKAIELNDEHLKSVAFQRLSMLDIFGRKFSSAEKFAKNSYKISININDDQLKLKSYELLFWINELGKYRTTIENLEFEEEFISLAKKYNKRNSLAYFLTHSFNALSFRGPSDQREDYYYEGHALAKELKNENCTLSAHLKTALVYAVNGLHNISKQYYIKVESLLIEMKDDFRLAQTYNGIGYYYLTAGKYKDANEYYNKALQHLKTDWNFDEICTTLVNKSINAMLVSDYSTAEKQLEILLNVVKELKLSRLRLTTLSRIYGIIALNNFYLGNSYRSYSFLSKMQTIISPNKYYEDDDEYFLNNFTQGLLLKKKGVLGEAEEFFQDAWSHLGKIKGSLKCLYPKFTLEYQKLLIECKKFRDSDDIIGRGYNYCKENNLEYYLNLFEEKENPKYYLGGYLSELTWIVEAAKQEASIRLLNDKVDEINFINNFQEILTSMEDKNNVINNSMILLENKFSLSYSLLISYDSEIPQIMYSSRKEKISDEKLSELGAIIYNYNSPFVTSEHTELSNYFEGLTNEKIKSLIYIPIIKGSKLKVAFICVTQVDNDVVNNKIVLNSSNLRIINIAIRQLSETIQKIQWQEKLVASVSTDMLTGLYNRQYFYNKISSLLKQCKKKTEIFGENICLFYIDLDNFKYYNDTFGHTIGDFVLIWFGEILRTVSTKKSSAIRYGGDEFLLFIEDCSKEQFIKIANRIYEEIKYSGGFRERIIEMLGTQIEIPQGNLLSCSIGISYSKLNEKLSVSKFIEEADKSLYEAKKSGKSKYVISKIIE